MTKPPTYGLLMFFAGVEPRSNIRRLGPSTKVCFLFLLCVATGIAAPAQTFKTLVNFDGTNGSSPTRSLIQGVNGNLYGTTPSGGKSGEGTVFEITTEGKLTTLYNFCSLANCADGSSPQASLVLAANGNFYGTTFSAAERTASRVMDVARFLKSPLRASSRRSTAFALKQTARTVKIRGPG